MTARVMAVMASKKLTATSMMLMMDDGDVDVGTREEHGDGTMVLATCGICVSQRPC